MAAAVRRQIEEIETLTDRSLAYASLLQLQRCSADDFSSMEALALYSSTLTPLLLSDIHHQDEEIAAQALKCLGFMIYHPSLIPSISEGDVKLVLESLVKLITTTRMKAVCNLGVWCISIQQLNVEIVGGNIDLLLRAIIHALDNPFASLSTTFEGIQAVMKLGSQLCDRMRDMSHIWVPPIYRRLVSADKRERDMAERCILKTKSILYPPPLTLSEIVKIDVKKNLLQRMVDLLHDQELKVYVIQAWGWYIFLLGSDALGDRHLLNKLLKIPEETFTCLDPQVQIASLVAWESLIEVLFPTQVIDHQSEIVMKSMTNSDNHMDSLLRRVKVIMMPLRRVISSKCDISIRSSCLNTWHYLLSKLDILINHPSVMMISFVPILDIVFSRGPESHSLCLWNSCLDLLGDFVSSKALAGYMDLTTKGNSIYLVNSKSSWKHYPMKWLPWEISNLNFHIKMISNIIAQDLMLNLTPKNRILACNASLRIFRSVLRGVQVELKTPSIHYDTIQFCVKIVFMFTREVCERLASEKFSDQHNDLICLALQFLNAIRDELDPSILQSPLHRIPLDVHYINMRLSDNIIFLPLQGLIGSLSYMDMVSPMVYSIILDLCMVAQASLNLSNMEGILRDMQQFKYLCSSENPTNNLLAVIRFLYMHVGEAVHGTLYWLTIWRVVAEGLQEAIDSVKDLSFLKTEYDEAGYTIIHWLLCYPLLMLFSRENNLKSGNEVGPIVEVWKSVFDSCNYASQRVSSSINNFTECLCKIFVGVLDENITPLGGDIKSLEKRYQNTLIFVFGEVSVHILKNFQVLDGIPLQSTVINQDSNDYDRGSPIKNVLGFVTRILGLLLLCMEVDQEIDHMVVSRVFAAMACLVDRIFFMRDIISIVEIISDPMVQWLSLCNSIHEKMKHGSIICQLKHLWERVLDRLQRIQPPIIFNSSLLVAQAPLLRTTLDHPDTSISDVSILFWNATYGRKTNLDYPQCLLPVLDKLSRNGRINLNGSSVKEATTVSLTMPKKIAGSSRKRLKIAKHPSKSSGMHQGRLMDIRFASPGKDPDFSQMFKHPPDDQVVRRPQCILGMLQRDK